MRPGVLSTARKHEADDDEEAATKHAATKNAATKHPATTQKTKREDTCPA